MLLVVVPLLLLALLLAVSVMMVRCAAKTIMWLLALLLA